MVHGFRGTNHGMHLIAQRLKNYRVIVPDLPGFGKSKPLDQPNIESYTMWLHAFIESLAIAEDTPFVLVGHSFGSIIASSYSASHKKNHKLVLINPVGYPALNGKRRSLGKATSLYYNVSRIMPEKVAYAWLASRPIVLLTSSFMVKTHDKTLRQYIHSQHLLHFSTFSTAKHLRETFLTSTICCVSDFAKDITQPTLLIVGDKDDITSIDEQYRLADEFSDAKINVIPDVGHLVHYEAPQQAADYILDFIK